MLNLEVMKRAYPCRYFRSDPTRLTECRSCDLLTHARPASGARTLCGHTCDDCGMAGWIVSSGAHVEDVPAIERCAVCWQAIAKMKRRERELHPAGHR